MVIWPIKHHKRGRVVARLVQRAFPIFGPYDMEPGIVQVRGNERAGIRPIVGTETWGRMIM